MTVARVAVVVCRSGVSVVTVTSSETFPTLSATSIWSRSPVRTSMARRSGANPDSSNETE